jgi:hypothetical protein
MKGVNYCMNGAFALTTFDNPYDPFEQFTSWFLFDVEKGYNTCAYLARIVRTSEQLSDEENNSEIERAIDEIILYDFRNIYKKVKRRAVAA